MEKLEIDFWISSVSSSRLSTCTRFSFPLHCFLLQLNLYPLDYFMCHQSLSLSLSTPPSLSFGVKRKVYRTWNIIIEENPLHKRDMTIAYPRVQWSRVWRRKSLFLEIDREITFSFHYLAEVTSKSYPWEECLKSSRVLMNFSRESNFLISGESKLW